MNRSRQFVGSSSEVANSATARENSMAEAPFLDLPYEIRLQIYHLVHLSNPVLKPQGAPFLFVPTSRRYVARAVAPDAGIGTCTDTGTGTPETTVSVRGRPEQNTSGTPSGARLLSSHRPMCHIPARLLQTCWQIYHEARCIPFRENEFIFVDWFTPGLASALTCSKDLTTWQLAELRYVRLELYAEHIAREDLDAGRWVALCGCWEGLRGLRLVLKTKGHGSYTRSQGQCQKETVLRDVWELVEERTEWISQGLGRLEQLQQLDIEVRDERVTRREKVQWCGLLQKVLRASSGRMDVLVTCIEKEERC